MTDLKQRARDYIFPIVVDGATRCLSYLSLSQAHRLGKIFSNLAWRLKIRPVQMVIKNLAAVFPDLDEIERDQLAQQTVTEAAKFAMESGAVSCWPEDQWRDQIKTVKGVEVLDAARERREPILILAPHYGNWEFVNLLVGRHGKVLYQRPRSKVFDKLIIKHRQRSGAQHVATDAQGIRELYKALRNGEQIGMLPDQVPGVDGGVNAPFFGLECRTMTLAHRLIDKFHPLVVIAFARRLPDAGGFEIVIEQMPDEIHSTDLVESLTAMNLAIERVVRMDPTQYQWAYNRFKQPRDKRLD